MKLVELESFLRDIDNVEKVEKDNSFYDDRRDGVMFEISVDDGFYTYPIFLPETGFKEAMHEERYFRSNGDIMEALGVEFADDDQVQDYEMAAEEISDTIREIYTELLDVIDLHDPDDITRVLGEGFYMDADGNQHEASELLEHVPYYVLKGMVDEQPPLSDQIKQAMKKVYNEDIDSKNDRDFDER